jgi:hypothetical protein
MVKCINCKYLDGYTEYGHEFIFCKHPDNDKFPEIIEDLSELNEVCEKEHNCRNWCNRLVEVPHELYMSIFAKMKLLN